MRDCLPREVEAELELELDRPAMSGEREERAELVLRQALRNVDMHGWSITDDGCRLRLEGGSVSLDLGLSGGITQYVEQGVGGQRLTTRPVSAAS
ncbi:MAG: hypothetical protein WBP81_01240 [Solirubrobacteraceae bacterium]